MVLTSLRLSLKYGKEEVQVQMNYHNSAFVLRVILCMKIVSQEYKAHLTSTFVEHHATVNARQFTVTEIT